MTERFYKVPVGQYGAVLTEDIPAGARVVLYHDGFDSRAIVFTWEEEAPAEPQDCKHPNMVEVFAVEKIDPVNTWCPDCKYVVISPVVTPQDHIHIWTYSYDNAGRIMGQYCHCGDRLDTPQDRVV